MTTRQPEALRLAEILEGGYSLAWLYERGGYGVSAELRRQHARITELESQLEAIGAGGVSGPLIGQPQAMPDLSQLTERGAKAWAGVDAQGLREGFTAADMATASAQGFRDGVASISANAGEPTCDMRTVVAVAVTMLYDTHPEDVCRVFDRNDLETIVSITEPLGHGRVEDIYRDAWDHVAAPPTAPAGATPAESVERIVHLRAYRERRIYVAGPMTGLPEFNFPLFNSTAERLRSEGWHVENPAEHGHVEGAGWADYLRWDISRIATCGAIYLLPGWSNSKGATLEVHIAGVLGLEVLLADGAEAPTPRPTPATQKLKEQICISDINQSAACAVGSVGTTSDAQTTRSTHDAPATQPSPTAPAAQQAGEVNEVAEHYRNAIASACEGWTMPDGLRKHLETALWSQPTPQPTQTQPVAREPLPKFLALKFHARRDKKATVTLLFPGHEAADAWVRGIKGGQHGAE